MDLFDEEQGAHLRSPVEQTAMFALLLAHLCEYSSLGFDSLEVLNSKAPIPSGNKAYIVQFLKVTARAGVDPIPFLASCLTIETTSSLLRGKPGARKRNRNTGLIVRCTRLSE